MLIVKLGLAHLGLDVGDKSHHFLDLGVSQSNGVQHHIFRHFVGAGFDHHDFFGAAGHGQVQLAYLPLLSDGVEHQLPVHQAHAHRSDGAVKGNIGDGHGNGSRQGAGDFRGVVHVAGQHRHDDGHIVAHILGKQGTHRPVHHPAGEDGVFAGAGFPLQKGTGDFAYAVQLFLIVHAEREKVDAFPWFGGCGDIAHHHSIAVLHPAGAVGKLAGLPYGDFQRPPGKGGFKHLLFVCHNWTSLISIGKFGKAVF